MRPEYVRVKGEFPASSSSSGREAPQPMEGLNEVGPPPFLTKTYEIVEDSATNHVVSWSKGNNSFVGFRKVDPDRWEFANEGFLRGQKHLLKNIRRRKSSQPQSSSNLDAACVELGRFGLDGEVDRLRRDKQVLMAELVKLRQQQQNTRAYLQAMEDRLKRTELKQQQMMNFLARAMQNPNFVQQLVQKMDKRRELQEAIQKKRVRPIKHGPDNVVDEVVVDEIGVGQSGGGGGGGAEIFVKMEPRDYSVNDMVEFEEVEVLDEPNTLSQNNNTEEEVLQMETGDEEQDEGFWQNLLNENREEEMGILSVDEDDEEDIDILAEQDIWLSRKM
ncbi:hypothetical protein TIFTF001_015947 [Ficus carica]|uniref:HSF-type DNA-binding domain-containing protein n=1 Tax=Ficus carica TaxID=3494 RepID=A0AA88A6U9_FICCA|nr:hypothetical protein TIFTF001_015947 [Ficus carica]